VLLLPVIVVACVLIALGTHQKPILRQVRVGYLGREFSMLKLRTMYAEERETVGRELPGRVFVYKTANDARVSAIGRVLRRASIDELPQLVNVLAGQMSLVGPRPALPVEVAHYPGSWRRRLTVKPGLTGLWQVSGRCEVEARRRIAMDRYYIRRRSLLFDCRILVGTVAALVSMRGAW
jgi:lipopolysaccharide/colanic/teichoic acid biosynthesis glycosyltransferase